MTLCTNGYELRHLTRCKAEMGIAGAIARVGCVTLSRVPLLPIKQIDEQKRRYVVVAWEGASQTDMN